MNSAKKVISVLVCGAMISVAIPMSALADNETLRKGDEGDAVKELQQILKDKGYFNEEVTGYFGKVTEAALLAYQSAAGLTPDGIAGEDTFSQLNAGQGNVLREGMENSKVTEIQERLADLGLFQNAVTGYFGPITTRAIMNFQEANGLTVDGLVGEETSEKLFKTYSANTLAPGMKNDNVKAMQKKLIELGYLQASATGFYGALTVSAVQYFQKANGLTVDGLAGPATLGKLESSSAKSEKDARRAATSSNSDTAKKSSNSSSSSNSGNASNSSSSSNSSNSSSASKAPSGDTSSVTAYAQQFLGRPYVYGANGPDAFDCSGFTTYVFRQFGVSLPRTAYDQGYGDYGTKISSASDLQPGDLVFFNTISDGDLSDHVGIYLGGGSFIHAGSGSSTRKVVISSLDSGYYKSRFSWGRRVL